MNTLDKKDLKQNYEQACNDYLKAFCDMYELQYEGDEAWVARQHGTLAYIGDYYFNFDDIRLCVDRRIPWNEVISWYDYNTQVHDIGLDCINLESWIMGAPRASRETIDHFYQIRRDFHDLIEEEKERIKQESNQQDTPKPSFEDGV